MLLLPTGHGRYERLSATDRPKIRRHWQRLSEDCIRRRFLRAMSAEQLVCRAETATEAGAISIGWFADGALRGMAELYPAGATGEAAFTVEPAWRRRGIARGLTRRVLRAAANRGLRSLTMMSTRGNTAMIRLALRAGAVLDAEGGEVTGRIALGPGTVASQMIEAAETGVAGAAVVAALPQRMAAIWLALKDEDDPRPPIARPVELP